EWIGGETSGIIQIQFRRVILPGKPDRYRLVNARGAHPDGIPVDYFRLGPLKSPVLSGKLKLFQPFAAIFGLQSFPHVGKPDNYLVSLDPHGFISRTGRNDLIAVAYLPGGQGQSSSHFLLVSGMDIVGFTNVD